MKQVSKQPSSGTRTLHSILIANRGEIASRIIRTCKKMGIRSIAVYSDADREAPFVTEADLALYIGDSAPQASYLDQDKLLDLCQRHQIDAIHPGYGFLSENADFAKKCQEANICFIGPHYEAIAAMGSKSRAKEIMQKHGVPIIPGYQGEDQSQERLIAEAKKVGFPLLLKAAAGGGGKGMRIVRKEAELATAIQAAQSEGKNSFGNAELIIEKYIASGRHIEFQIFGDQHGQALHIFERECSIQRRYQKVIEESPSPVLDEELREKMGQAAIQAAQALKYDNAGTVEFIFDEKSREFYFLEVNTRLQVEHPVTEAITGLDLVEMQIECAEGQALKFAPGDIQSRGYAVECRLYAEDPEKDFVPATGKILYWYCPEMEGLRVETAVQTNSEISIFYDPMIAKIIVWADTRHQAHRKMHYVLKNLICLGLKTNQDFLIQLFENSDFRQGKYDTHFLQEHFDFHRLGQSSPPAAALIALSLANWQKREQKRVLMKSVPSGWRNSFYQYQEEKYRFQEETLISQYRYLGAHAFEFMVGGEKQSVRLIEIKGPRIVFELNQERLQYYFAQNASNYYLRNESQGAIHLIYQERFPEKELEKIKGGYKAPMPSQVVKVLVEVGQSVKSGQGLVTLSSMKMENTIEAQEDGQVEEIYVKEGQSIETDFLLLKLKLTD